MTGFIPTSFSITTSRAKPAFSAGSTIALPPYLMMIVLSWKRWMYGSASARIWAFTAALTASIGMAGRGRGATERGTRDRLYRKRGKALSGMAHCAPAGARPASKP